MREIVVKKPPLSLPPWGEGVMSQGGGTQQKKCVHERVQCHVHVFFSSVTVSQCRREGVQGGGGLQLVKGLLLTVDRRGLQCTVYSLQYTVSLQLVNGVQGGLQSTVEVEVYSSLGNSLYCRL